MIVVYSIIDTVFKTYVAFHPKRKRGKEPMLYEDLIALNGSGKNRSVSRMIGMMDDLK
jgi:hypothetical protein